MHDVEERGGERFGAVLRPVKTGNSQRLFDAAYAACAGHEDNHVNCLANQGVRQGGRRFLDQLFKTSERAARRIGM